MSSYSYCIVWFLVFSSVVCAQTVRTGFVVLENNIGHVYADYHNPSAAPMVIDVSVLMLSTRKFFARHELVDSFQTKRLNFYFSLSSHNLSDFEVEFIANGESTLVQQNDFENIPCTYDFKTDNCENVVCEDDTHQSKGICIPNCLRMDGQRLLFNKYTRKCEAQASCNAAELYDEESNRCIANLSFEDESLSTSFQMECIHGKSTNGICLCAEGWISQFEEQPLFSSSSIQLCSMKDSQHSFNTREESEEQDYSELVLSVCVICVVASMVCPLLVILVGALCSSVKMSLYQNNNATKQKMAHKKTKAY